jgi:hypothetical protein
MNGIPKRHEDPPKPPVEKKPSRYPAEDMDVLLTEKDKNAGAKIQFQAGIGCLFAVILKNSSCFGVSLFVYWCVRFKFHLIHNAKSLMDSSHRVTNLSLGPIRKAFMRMHSKNALTKWWSHDAP